MYQNFETRSDLPKPACFFPIKHENMTARRWPLITLGLILLNFLIFLCTHQTMENQEEPLLSVKVHVLVLAAQHPELTVPPEAQQLVTDFQALLPGQLGGDAESKQQGNRE